MARETELRTLLKKHRRRLQIRKEQAVEQGISVEPSILTEIEDIEAAIETLETELAAIESDEGALISDAPAGQPAAPGAVENGPNPFTITGTIDQAGCFIGRAAELRRLLAMLQGGAVSLIGAPKIGKSSLLQALKRAWPGHALGPIDCQLLEDAEDFFQALAKTLNLAGHTWRGHLRPALRTAGALILIDELDYAADLGLTPVDLGRIRAVRNANPGLKLITASRRPLKEVLPDPKIGSEWYNTIVPFTLDALPNDEAAELLRHPWQPAAAHFDPAAVAELLALTGGHPFKLQRAAYHRYEALTDPAYDWRSYYHLDMDHLL